MDTPTLDEIEAQTRTLCGAAPTQDGYVRGDVEAACNIALALVAHVRALENVTRMTDDRAFERIAALEEKVAALEFNEIEATELVAEDAAFAKTVADRALELDRLRAENAELRKGVDAPVTSLRIVHDPDTGCSGCLCFDRRAWWCKVAKACPPDEASPAPPWCQLRAGYVVVSARKDGG